MNQNLVNFGMTIRTPILKVYNIHFVVKWTCILCYINISWWFCYCKCTWGDIDDESIVIVSLSTICKEYFSLMYHLMNFHSNLTVTFVIWFPLTEVSLNIGAPRWVTNIVISFSTVTLNVSVNKVCNVIHVNHLLNQY